MWDCEQKKQKQIEKWYKLDLDTPINDAQFFWLTNLQLKLGPKNWFFDD